MHSWYSNICYSWYSNICYSWYSNICYSWYSNIWYSCYSWYSNICYSRNFNICYSWYISIFVILDIPIVANLLAPFLLNKQSHRYFKTYSSFLIAKLLTMVGQLHVRKGQKIQERREKAVHVRASNSNKWSTPGYGMTWREKI